MIYPYRCLKCGEYVEVIRTVSGRDDPVKCVRCGELCRRQICSVSLMLDRFVYRDENRDHRDQTDIRQGMRDAEKFYERKWAPNPSTVLQRGDQ